MNVFFRPLCTTVGIIHYTTHYIISCVMQTHTRIVSLKRKKYQKNGSFDIAIDETKKYSEVSINSYSDYFFLWRFFLKRFLRL